MVTKFKGTRDYFGLEAKRFELTTSILERVAKEFSLNKVITPTFEKTELFSRAVGNDTDVVNKEMYTFNDRKERSISLRPEGTASTVRLALENKLLDNNGQEDVYYIASMFRYERPQKGRQREFYQFGVERFGKDSAFVDVETIMTAIKILRDLNITKYELQINSIGNSNDRAKYNSSLKEFISSKLEQLSEYAKEKYNLGNVLRVFDSKVDSDLELLKDAPTIFEYINDESKERFEQIKNLLNEHGVEYTINQSLVRGLDYYNDIVFEFVSTDVENLGSKSTIIGGGRYDSLVSKFDESKDVPAIGFAIGIERLMLAATAFLDANTTTSVDNYVAVAYEEEAMQNAALKVANTLRQKGETVETDFSKRKLAKKFELAEKHNATNVYIIGNEVAEGKITIKNIKEGTSKEVNLKEI